jgi:hypothetical protein
VINDLDGEFGIGWIGDVFFLNGGININGSFLNSFALQLNAVWNIFSKPSVPIRFLK